MPVTPSSNSSPGLSKWGPRASSITRGLVWALPQTYRIRDSGAGSGDPCLQGFPCSPKLRAPGPYS